MTFLILYIALPMCETMTNKIVTYEIEYCNSTCIHFYHKYEDMENCWCSKINKKIFECDTLMNLNDYKKREIPKVCPLENSSQI